MMNDPIGTIKGKKILVTGSTGYLATCLITRLQDAECSIIRLSQPGAHFTSTVGKAEIQNIEGDISKSEVWESVLTDVDFVFHFAAQTSVYVAEKQPFVDWQHNVLPMLQLLETCKKQGFFPKILFAGTVTEAGLPNSLPVDETHPDRPITIYDLHKLMAESYLEYYTRIGVVQGVTLRLANVYGPGVSSSADRGILNKMIRKALSGETITIYGDGNFLRDYVFIDDVVSAFLSAANHIDETAGQHFVIGSGEKYTLDEAFNLIADRVFLRAGMRVPVVHVAFPKNLSPIEERNFVANTRRFQQATGWRAKNPLISGIDRTIEYKDAKY